MPVSFEYFEAEANPTETHRCLRPDRPADLPASKWSILSQVVMSFVGHKGPASIAWWYCMSMFLSPLIEVKVHQEYWGDSYQEDNVKKNRTLKRKWISMTQRHRKRGISLWSAAKSLCSYLGKQIDEAIWSYCESHMQISSHWISGQEGLNSMTACLESHIWYLSVRNRERTSKRKSPRDVPLSRSNRPIVQIASKTRSWIAGVPRAQNSGSWHVWHVWLVWLWPCVQMFIRFIRVKPCRESFESIVKVSYAMFPSELSALVRFEETRSWNFWHVRWNLVKWYSLRRDETQLVFM